MTFAPGLVGTYQDSEGGSGRHRPLPPMSGNSSWRGSGSKANRARFLERRVRAGAARETSCFVSQPLALCANQRAIGAGHVIDAQGDPVVVAEIKFRRVAMQVLFADVEVAAVYAALEDREEILDRVGVPKCGGRILRRCG